MRDVHPSIFPSAADWRAAVADYLKMDGETVIRDTSLSTEVHDWGSDKFFELSSILDDNLSKKRVY